MRVLQANGCEVTVPENQTCCGALHVHSGLRDKARELACRNIDAFLGQGFDAILTNAAGCGSTLAVKFLSDNQTGVKARQLRPRP